MFPNICTRILYFSFRNKFLQEKMKKIIYKYHNALFSRMRRNCTMRLLVVLSMLVSGYGVAEAATYTYKLVNASGEVVAETENTTNRYELPWYMESPYVTEYHFYDDETRAGTAHAKDDALSLADGSTIYVTYDVDTSRAPFDKANGTYSITINGKKIYAQTSGIWQSSNNSYTDADLWTVSGDPYSLKIHPKADASQWIQTANANNGTEFMPGTSSTVMLIKGQNNNNADNIIMCANNGQTVISDTRPQANWYQGKSQLKNWVTTKGDDKIAFTEEINPDDLFTVILVDKQGNEVFNVKADASTGDPLPRQYRSPFAENYKYYETKAEAQANSGTETDWEVDGKIVYVGYDVVSNFGGDNAWNIYGAGANGKYVHPVYQRGQQGKYSNSEVRWWQLINQQKDYSDGVNISTSNFPFLDNSYAWQFAGDTPDPYNALLKNKGTGMYVKYYTQSGNRLSDWMMEDATNADLDRSTAQAMVVTQLPQIDINVVNADGDVELTLPGYYKDGATWNNSMTPFYLQRAFTSEHTFYYDAACTDAITGTVDNSKINGAVYVKYTLASYWSTLSEDEYTNNVMPSPTDGFALNNQSNQVGAVADHQHQFALVGNPYSTRLYSRQAGQCLGYDGSKIVFADATTASTELELLVSDNPNYKQFMPAVRGTGKNIYNNTGNFELREIIVPVSVFKEGATAQADIKDMQEYAFTLDGRATNDRIATDMLNTTDNSIGTTHDYQHAFCDYTFYGEYNGSALSSPVPDDGLPIFGGKEQKHCAFFATYTVDEEQFDRLYLIANVAENQFTGKGAATSSPAGYGLTIAGSLDAARADTENTFRWLMTGDPYNLQLTCPGPSFIGLLHLIRGKAASFVKSNSAILFCCKCFDGKKLTAC